MTSDLLRAEFRHCTASCYSKPLALCSLSHRWRHTLSFVWFLKHNFNLSVCNALWTCGFALWCSYFASLGGKIFVELHSEWFLQICTLIFFVDVALTSVVCNEDSTAWRFLMWDCVWGELLNLTILYLTMVQSNISDSFKIVHELSWFKYQMKCRIRGVQKDSCVNNWRRCELLLLSGARHS